MTGPKPSSAHHKERARARIDSLASAREQAQVDSLRKEAYGDSGAALRKTAAQFGEADAQAHAKRKGLVAKIKDFFDGD